MHNDRRVILIVSPNRSLGEALRNAIVSFFPGIEVHLSADARDALWRAADIRPHTLIIDYHEDVTSPLSLVHKVDLLDECPRIIILVDPESAEYTEGLTRKVREGLPNRPVTMVSFENFIVNIRSHLELIADLAVL